jgi:hypothetical protein
MRKLVKDFIMGMLVWFCIIWMCVFDPNQFGHWLKIALYIGGATWFWWWIGGYENPFKEPVEKEVV